MSYKMLNTFRIAGWQYRDEFVKTLLATEGRLALGSAFFLVPEPDNPVDPQAVKLIAGGHNFGYVPHRWLPYTHLWIDRYGLDKLRAVYRGRQRVSIILYE